MRHITTALRSSKIATLLAFGLAGLYAATEFGGHPSQQAGAAIPEKLPVIAIPGAADPMKTVALSVPKPLLRPDNLPFIEQPHQIDVVSLTRKWSGMSFDLAQIRAGQEVPRYFVEQIPVDILDINQVQIRKKVFLSVALPLILRVNEEILARRGRLLKILAVAEIGAILSPSDAEWVNQLTDLYGAESDNLEDLLTRVDVIPVSLALAQSIEESGWGTSRFAREGNALFGQRVWSPGNGIVPEDRGEGMQYEVKVYDELLQSIRGYAHNLNSHFAYAVFRSERSGLKQQHGSVSGYELTHSLTSYSERGEAYVEALQALIRVNNLGQFDDAILAPEQVAQIFN